MNLTREKVREYFFKGLPYLIFLVFSILLIVPFMVRSINYGHDIKYHFVAIESLDYAYNNGSFLSRIYDLTCQDYGYGTGLFYSMLPAALCVIIKNFLNISAFSAVCIELIIVLFLSQIFVYRFLREIVKNKKHCIILSLLYVSFPYVLGDIYIRFSLSELFLFMLVPMIAHALYELVEKENYKSFIPLFVVGFSLSIILHLSLTLYITLFSAIYLLLNAKKFFKRKNICIFAISCVFVLLISCTYYLPMLINRNIVNLSDMGYSGFYIFYSIIDGIQEFGASRMFLISSFFVTLVVYIIYLIKYLENRKNNTKLQKSLFIISSIVFYLASPLAIVWIFFNSTIFNMIQFGWRLYLFISLFYIFWLYYIFKNIKIKKLIVCGVSGLFFVFGLTLMVIYSYGANFAPRNFDSRINGLSFNQGIGSEKVGNYYPKGATNEYVFYRANDMILESDVEITEFANYQGLKQISFVIEEDTRSSYVILKIPYDVCNGLKVYQCDSIYTTNIYELEYNFESKDGINYLKIEFIETGVSSKIILDYENCETLENYLKENPFEFIIINGEATFTNFVKTNSHCYDVDIVVDNSVTVELPTLYYKGYVATLITQDGQIHEIELTSSENGFLEANITESGTLHIEFRAGYVTLSNVISIFGIISFVIFYVIYINFDKLKNKFEKNKKIELDNTLQEQSTKID